MLLLYPFHRPRDEPPGSAVAQGGPEWLPALAHAPAGTPRAQTWASRCRGLSCMLFHSILFMVTCSDYPHFTDGKTGSGKSLDVSDVIEPGGGKLQHGVCPGQFYLGLGKPRLSWTKCSRKGVPSPTAGFWLFYGVQVGGAGEIRAPVKSKVGPAKVLGLLEQIIAFYWV